MGKDFFNFKWFDELQVGDVFKFCPITDSDIPSKFFTAFAKDEVNVLRLCVCLPLAQCFNLQQMLMGQIAQNRCYKLAAVN